jgi:GNAT superfamily N-acetyltransferase
MTSGDFDARTYGDEPCSVEFVACRTDHPDANALLGAFFHEQVGRYGFAESVDLDPDVYAEPNGIFVVIYRGGSPVGCGGCRRFEPRGHTFEIKKTYLIPEMRGCGLGRRLLDLLESTAVNCGARRIILETGVRNQAALGLFASRGYMPMARYVTGRDPAINRAFEKILERPSPGLTADRVQRATV